LTKYVNFSSIFATGSGRTILNTELLAPLLALTSDL